MKPLYFQDQKVVLKTIPLYVNNWGHEYNEAEWGSLRGYYKSGSVYNFVSLWREQMLTKTAYEDIVIVCTDGKMRAIPSFISVNCTMFNELEILKKPEPKDMEPEGGEDIELNYDYNYKDNVSDEKYQKLIEQIKKDKQEWRVTMTYETLYNAEHYLTVKLIHEQEFFTGKPKECDDHTPLLEYKGTDVILEDGDSRTPMQMTFCNSKEWDLTMASIHDIRFFETNVLSMGKQTMKTVLKIMNLLGFNGLPVFTRVFIYFLSYNASIVQEFNKIHKRTLQNTTLPPEDNADHPNCEKWHEEKHLNKRIRRCYLPDQF